MRGGVRRLNSEFSRVVQKYRQLFKRDFGSTDFESGTILGYVRSIPKRSESARQAKKQIVELRIMLNQNNIGVTTKEINSMSYDELIVTYETVIEQIYQKYLEMQQMEKQMRR